jgi:hypothetical protein
LGRNPLVVSDGALVFFPTARSFRIPLSELTGVGLVLTWRGGINQWKPVGWYLTLWDRDQKRYQISDSALPATLPAQSGDGPLHETAEQIASSAAAATAKRVYDLALSAQGPTGALATAQAQQFTRQDASTRSPSFLAYWSPDDGEIGRKPTSTPLSDEG